MKTIMSYFDETVEYPQDIALNPIPMNTLWCYVSSTFLNGFINHVTPLKVFVLDRYEPDKTEKIKKLKRQIHTKLSQFGDDIIILSEIGENTYMFFWFDMDVSDCYIGRFETTDSKDEVIDSLTNWLNKQKEENEGEEFYEGIDNGIWDYHELPLSFLEGWISF